MIWTPHSDKQEQAVFSDRKITLCGTGIQWGKGLPEDELVLTCDGYREARSIEVGSVLFDRNGEETKVVGVYPQGIRPCYQITFTDRTHLITDDNHLNVIVPRKGRPERIISTKDLYDAKFLWAKVRRGASKARVPAVKPIKFKERIFVINPYTMGVLIGDGGITKTLVLSSVDQDIIDRVSRDLPDDLKLTRKNQRSCDYTITNRERRSDENGHGFNPYINELRRLGLFGKKSAGKFVPDEYKYASIEQRLDVLRGLMDTDGTVTNKEGSKSSRKIEFDSVSERLAHDVIWLVESLGGKAWCRRKETSYIYNGKKRSGLNCFRVNIILPNFNPFYLPRKAKLHFCHENTADKVIENIVPVEPRKTICFKVDSPTETFVARGQVVTHNTRVGAVRTKLKMHTYTAEDDAFIIAAPSYKIMEQSTLPAFMAIMGGLGSYNTQKAQFRMHGGGICYFRTSTDPDSIVGITNVRHIWGDEAGKYPLYFWENLQGRASFKDCQIDLTTSPYSLNWIFKEIIRPKLRDPNARPDALWVHARSDENPYFPIEEYNRRKATMDPRRFAAMYGGQWERMAGLVYDCFEEAENQCEAFALPAGTRFFGGIDWGHTEPFVLKIRAITPDGNHYGVSEFYKSGMTISEIVGVVKAKHQVFDLTAVYCGPDQPAHIMELNRAGIVALPADNNVRLGIDRHYELLKTRRLKYFRNLNPYTMDEIDTYHYPDPDSLGPDDNVKENKPVQQHDHAMDAERYLSIMTYSNTAKLVPRVAQDNTIRLDHWAETEKLKKKPRMNTQTEKWG